MRIRLSKRGVGLVAIVALVAILGPLRGPISSTPGIGVPFMYLYYWTDQFKFWGTKSKSPDFRDLAIPRPNNRPLGSKAVGPHFKSTRSYFVLTSDPTPIFANASDRSRVIRTLRPGVRVRSVFQDDSKTAANSHGRGQWVFLTQEDGVTPVGWAINNTLGYQDKFVPASNWTVPELGLCVGEYCAEFKIKPNGRFTEYWESIGRGIQLHGKNTGQVMVYQSIYWAKQDDPENYDELLIRDDRYILRHEDKFKREPIRVSAAGSQPLRNSKLLFTH